MLERLASTLGREVALAAAYLRLMPAGRSGRLEVAVRVDAGAIVRWAAAGVSPAAA